MRLIRVTQTPWIRSVRDRGALAPVSDRPRRVLAAVAGPSLTAALSPRLPTPGPLADVVRALGGRLVVTNPVAVARLPHAVVSLTRAVLATVLRADGTAPLPAPDAPLPPGVLPFASTRERADRRLASLIARLPEEARSALGPGAAWMAVALYEPDTLDVLVRQDGPVPIAPEPPALLGLSRHRLVLVTGRGATPGSWDVIDEAAAAAPAVAWPPASEGQPWFLVGLLVSDAHVTAGMDATTLARWAALTGRAGPGSRDAYWHADTWDRFREPGRRVGHVTPQVVGQSRRSRLVEDAGIVALTPDVERGVGVPPGYCLVDCAGLLDVAVVAA